MQFVKYLFKTILFIFALVSVYFAISYILEYFPTKDKCKNSDVSIFLYSTDIGLLSHTEIIIKTDYFSKENLKLFDGLLRKNRRGYLAFSYGDADFMMDTKGFDDLNLTLAFRGLFINTPALIKVGHYGNFYKDKTIKIDISYECLEKLKISILNSFEKKDKSLIRYIDVYKDRSFYFYKAKRGYNLFHTCNTWTGDRLRDSDIGMSYWTPFAHNIINCIK